MKVGLSAVSEKRRRNFEFKIGFLAASVEESGNSLEYEHAHFETVKVRWFLSAGGATADKWMTVTSSQWLCKFSCPKILQIRAY